MKVVLDSWAVLRHLEGMQPVARRIEQRLSEEPRPLMSWINVGEVFSVTHRLIGERGAQRVVRGLRALVDIELRVIEAARIKADHRMAYADAFAAATAIASDAVLWTGDPELLVDGAPWQWEDLRSLAQ